jgi:folate-dependent tRNA-U54 methylase TrmFO/GidA
MKLILYATGPLTSVKMSNEILRITGKERLYFYDAALLL